MDDDWDQNGVERDQSVSPSQEDVEGHIEVKSHVKKIMIILRS